MGASTIVLSNKKYLWSYMCIIHLTTRLQRGNIGFQTGIIRYVLLFLTITVTYNFTFFYYSWLHLFLFSGIFFFSQFFTSFGNIFYGFLCFLLTFLLLGLLGRCRFFQHYVPYERFSHLHKVTCFG